jgi:GntR family transcriptional regulator
VLRAYRELELAGLVEPRQGAGTFVRQTRQPPPVDVTALRAELATWVDRARAAGLDLADMHALVTDVATDPEVSHAHVD